MSTMNPTKHLFLPFIVGCTQMFTSVHASEVVVPSQPVDPTSTLRLFGWFAPPSTWQDAGAGLSRDVQHSSPHHVHAKLHPRDSSSPAFYPEAAAGHRATVVTAMEAEGFNTSYLELDAGGKRFWIAVAAIGLEAGDEVRFSTRDMITMNDFQSRALGYSFDRIFFVSDLQIAH